MSIDHSDHGRGTAEEGPDSPDCPCRTGVMGERLEYARAGCGFCRVAVTKKNEERYLVPYNSDWKNKKTGDLYLVTSDRLIINATNAQDGQRMVMYTNGKGVLFVRELEEFLQKFEYVPMEMWF